MKLEKKLRKKFKKQAKSGAKGLESFLKNPNAFKGSYKGIRAFRKVAKKGIFYRDEIYTFDGYEKYIGEKVIFLVLKDCLIVSLKHGFVRAERLDI